MFSCITTSKYVVVIQVCSNTITSMHLVPTSPPPPPPHYIIMVKGSLNLPLRNLILANYESVIARLKFCEMFGCAHWTGYSKNLVPWKKKYAYGTRAVLSAENWRISPMVLVFFFFFLTSGRCLMDSARDWTPASSRRDKPSSCAASVASPSPVTH